jgi:hypothetical protein
VQMSAVAVLQLNSSGSGSLGYVGLRSGPILVESNTYNFISRGSFQGKKEKKKKKRKNN